MKHRLVHTNHLGNVCSEHGNVCRKDTTAQMEFVFATLEEARQHARAFVRRFPELQCEIYPEDGSVEEIVRNEEAQSEFIRRYCTLPLRDRVRDILMITLIIASLIGNVVMATLLFLRRGLSN